MYSFYPPSNCDQINLLSLVYENSLVPRRNVVCLIFLQRPLRSDIMSPSMLSEIKMVVPRTESRNHITFQALFAISTHLWLRVSNCITNSV